MNEVDFQTLLSTGSAQILWSGLKILYLIAFGIYLAFSVVVISQVKQMAQTLSDKFGKQSVFVSWLHFALSLLALVWAIVIL